MGVGVQRLVSSTKVESSSAFLQCSVLQTKQLSLLTFTDKHNNTNTSMFIESTVTSLIIKHAGHPI